MSLEATVAWILKKYIHTIEYYLAIKRNKAVICATTWMNFKNVMESERGQFADHRLVRNVQKSPIYTEGGGEIVVQGWG